MHKTELVEKNTKIKITDLHEEDCVYHYLDKIKKMTFIIPKGEEIDHWDIDDKTEELHGFSAFNGNLKKMPGTNKAAGCFYAAKYKIVK